MFDLGEEEEEHLYFVPLDEEANEENLEEWEKHLMIEKMFPVDREFIHISDAFSSEEERAALSKQLGYVRDQAVHLYQSAKSICRGTIKKSSMPMATDFTTWSKKHAQLFQNIEMSAGMNTRCIDDRCIKGFVPNIKEEPDLPDSSFVVLGISVL